MTSPQPPYGDTAPPTPQDARARAKADKAYRKASRPFYRKKRFIFPALLVLLIIIIVLANKGGGSSSGGHVAAAPATASAAAPAPGATPESPSSAAPAAAAPTTYAGKGDDVVKITKDAGPAIVTFDCARCSGNTVLQSDGADLLLVNTIDGYTGRRLIDAMDGSTTSTLTVKATGSWKITVASGLASAKKGDTSVNGHGDDVAVLTGNISKAAITNKGGQSNFVVQAYSTGSSLPDLAVNTIGGYTGTVPVQGPVALAITSTGDWTVSGS